MGRKAIIPESEHSKIVDMYKNGMTQYDISKIYGVSQSAIARIIKNTDKDWEFRKGKTIPKDEYLTICELYNEGIAQSEIANRYGCSTSLISLILRQMGVKTRLGGSKNTADIVEEWKRMYLSGVSLGDIAKQYNSTRATVSKQLKNNGVDIDRYTYHFDEHYFDNIDSQDKAYILGLLWADGYNNIDKGSIIVSLQRPDKDLLEKINFLTCNERPLRKICLSEKNSTWQDQYMITWQSKHVSKLLDQYGMHKKKTLILEYPQWIDPVLHRHFIRGYLDGDGCISLSKSGKYASVSMVGTSMFLNAIKDIIKENLDVDVVVQRDIRARDPICTLRCGTKDGVSKILEWIYDDASLFLDRKYQKYQQFLNINNSYLN